VMSLHFIGFSIVFLFLLKLLPLHTLPLLKLFLALLLLLLLLVSQLIARGHITSHGRRNSSCSSCRDGFIGSASDRMVPNLSLMVKSFSAHHCTACLFFPPPPVRSVLFARVCRRKGKFILPFAAH
jgi:hypothetical protein